MTRLATLLLLLLAALPARGETPAERVVAGLSQNRVAITTGFTGSEIFIYGAVSRAAPAPEGELDVIITVIGPSQPVTVRKKERQFGIWVKGDPVQVDAAPSFYAVATTRNFRDIISWTEDLRHAVGLTYAVRLIGNPGDETYPEDYRDALMRLRQKQGLYVDLPGTVTVTENTLFQTRVSLPAKLVEGEYRARILLLRDKEVVDTHVTSISVHKEGLERWLYMMAQEQGLLYGILSIAVGLFAGWLASAIFRLIP